MGITTRQHASPGETGSSPGQALPAAAAHFPVEQVLVWMRISWTISILKGGRLFRRRRRVKKREGGSTPPPPPPDQNPLNIQSDQQAVDAVNAWDLDCVNATLKLCEQRLQQSRRQQGYLLLNRERILLLPSSG